MTRKNRYTLTDIRELICYKMENGTESDQEYELYLSIINGEFDKEQNKQLLKQLMKELKEYEIG